eukprot:5307986-Alexandrium_andersonii.AAC.1
MRTRTHARTHASKQARKHALRDKQFMLLEACTHSLLGPAQMHALAASSGPHVERVACLAWSRCSEHAASTCCTGCART